MYEDFQIGHDYLVWTGDGETIRIEAWGRNSVRVRATRNDAFNPHDWALLPKDKVVEANQRTIDYQNKIEKTSDESCSISLDQNKGEATLTNGSIIVKARSSHHYVGSVGYEVFRCELSFWDDKGRCLLREAPAGGSLMLKAREYEPIAGGSYGLKVSFISSQDEHLYGMGEYQQNILDIKGCTFELAHRNSQASVPFVVSSAGYGFLWHNPAIGRAVFGKNRTEWEARSSDQIDYWITAGDDYAQIESQYADATGHAPVMPEWGLGFWQSKLRYWNQDQVIKVAHGFKERDIPLDLLVVDFFHWPHMGDYRFEDEFWPDPAAMVRELDQLGIKLMVSIWPQVSIASENFVEMKKRNYLTSTEAGLDLDMMFEEPSVNYDATNPGAREFVWNLCKKNYWDKGVRAFWLDEAEPEYGVYDFRNYRYSLGSDLNVGNIYPQLYNKGFYDGQVAEGAKGQIVNLTRCAWAGSQRYGSLVWSGDVGSTFEDMRSQITCAIHMGMAGIPWFTTDMGGFHDGIVDTEDFRELLSRWCAFSCFLPVMRNHGDRSLHSAGGKESVKTADGCRRSPSGADNEPWSYGPQVEQVFRKFIKAREVMRPYTRSLFREAHECGLPLVRGLFFEFPGDRMAADISDEYMFGPDLLVAPVVEAGARARKVWLPGDEGLRWRNLHTGEELRGGQEVQVQTPIDVIPVFACDGKDHGLLGLV